MLQGLGTNDALEKAVRERKVEYVPFNAKENALSLALLFHKGQNGPYVLYSLPFHIEGHDRGATTEGLKSVAPTPAAHI